MKRSSSRRVNIDKIAGHQPKENLAIPTKRSRSPARFSKGLAKNRKRCRYSRSRDDLQSSRCRDDSRRSRSN